MDELRTVLSRADLDDQLRRLRAASALSPNELRVLAYLLERRASGRPGAATGKELAEEVFGRKLEAYDSKRDPLVRVTMLNLRKKLRAYYATSGTGDPVILEVPLGSYGLAAERRIALSDAALRELWNARVQIEQRTPKSFSQALRRLNAILTEYPNAAPVLGLKAELLMTRCMYGFPPMKDLMEARRIADTVLPKLGNDWRIHVVDGGLLALLDHDWSAAFAAFGRGMEKDFAACSVHPWYTACLAAQGRVDEAIILLREAINDKGYSSPTMRGDLSALEILGQCWAAAEETIQGTIELFPNYYIPYLHRVMLLAATGDPDRALVELNRIPLSLSERPVTWGFGAYLNGLCGQSRKAERWYRWLQWIRKARYVPAAQLALAAIGAGRDEEGLDWMLTGMLVEKDPLCLWSHLFPALSGFHGKERFENALRTMGLRRPQRDGLARTDHHSSGQPVS